MLSVQPDTSAFYYLSIGSSHRKQQKNISPEPDY